MPRIVVAPRAVEDLRGLRAGLGLPSDTSMRVRRSLQLLRRFPHAGAALGGRWEGTRFVIGPWPWMVIVHVHDTVDTVYVVAVHDGRSSSAATGG